MPELDRSPLYALVTRHFLWRRNGPERWDPAGTYTSMEEALAAAAPNAGAMVPCYWEPKRQEWCVGSPSGIYRIAPRSSLEPFEEVP